MSPYLGLSWGITLIHLFFTAFFAITFIESALNKMMNYKGSHEYFESKFKDTFLKSSIGFFLPMIMVFETLTALLSIFGFLFIILAGYSFVALVASIFAMITFLMLFAGLRISRDYTSAAGLVAYIMITLLGLFFLIL